MKHLLLTTIAAVLVVGCGPSEADRALLKYASSGNIEAAKQAIADGADVNAKDRGGATPLHQAAFNAFHQAALSGHKETVELLIAKGADVNAKDDKGTTPLDWAILFGQPETAALLHKHGGKTAEELKAAGNSIHDAAYKGNIEAVKQHLAAGVDVNAKDSVGWTALHQAAYGAHKEPVELLIAEGADVNAKGDDGTTPLDMANDRETADLLRKHGGKTREELK
jgi:ankyrin repeat protein